MIKEKSKLNAGAVFERTPRISSRYASLLYYNPDLKDWTEAAEKTKFLLDRVREDVLRSSHIIKGFSDIELLEIRKSPSPYVHAKEVYYQGSSLIDITYDRIRMTTNGKELPRELVGIIEYAPWGKPTGILANLQEKFPELRLRKRIGSTQMPVGNLSNGRLLSKSERKNLERQIKL